MPCKLSVNVNKIALLRNSRGSNIPNVVSFALDCQRYGADGITIHPRPDERHIRKTDVYELAAHFPNQNCEYNIEGFPSDDFVKMVCKVKPTQVTLVPDGANQLTSDHGWDVIKNKSLLTTVLQEFREQGIRTSLFIDPIENQLHEAKNVGTDRIEFYTGPYAHDYAKNKEKAILPIKKVIPLVHKLGLGINAGHDLNLDNLQYFNQQIDGLLEVSIGHALVKDCLYLGLENTINMYKRLLK
ncbi:MAG: pyridoxine 5'-phosphate synthase [Bacteroidetes bacterium]|nr:pyridoxine 5'-phosphate synthase [Bacteroidota bacterium]